MRDARAQAGDRPGDRARGREQRSEYESPEQTLHSVQGTLLGSTKQETRTAILAWISPGRHRVWHPLRQRVARSQPETCEGNRGTMDEMEHLTGTRIRREATPATVNLRRCKLVVIKGAQRGTEFVITGDVFRVGKAPENDLVLTDETVSRVHFEIMRDGKGYLVRDLKSTNGTF